jgi:hypothetical protein
MWEPMYPMDLETAVEVVVGTVRVFAEDISSADAIDCVHRELGHDGIDEWIDADRIRHESTEDAFRMVADADGEDLASVLASFVG